VLDLRKTCALDTCLTALAFQAMFRLLNIIPEDFLAGMTLIYLSATETNGK